MSKQNYFVSKTAKAKEQAKKKENFLKVPVGKNGEKKLTKKIIEWNLVRNNKQRFEHTKVYSNVQGKAEFLAWYASKLSKKEWDISKKDKKYYNKLVYGIKSVQIILRSEGEQFFNEEGEELTFYAGEWCSKKQIEKKSKIVHQKWLDGFLNERPGSRDYNFHNMMNKWMKTLTPEQRKKASRARDLFGIDPPIKHTGDLNYFVDVDRHINHILEESPYGPQIIPRNVFKTVPKSPIKKHVYTNAFSLTPLHLWATKIYQEKQLCKRGLTLQDYLIYAECCLFNWLHITNHDENNLALKWWTCRLPVHKDLFMVFSMYSSMSTKSGIELHFIPYEYSQSGNTDLQHFELSEREATLSPPVWYETTTPNRDFKRISPDLILQRPEVFLSQRKTSPILPYGMLPLYLEVTDKLVDSQPQLALEVVSLEPSILKGAIPSRMIKRGACPVYHNVDGELSRIIACNEVQLPIFDVWLNSYYWELDGGTLTVPIFEL